MWIFPTNTRRRNLSGEENAENVHMSFPWGEEMSTQGEVFREKFPGTKGNGFPISPVPAWNGSDDVTAQQLFGMSSYRKSCRIPGEPGADPDGIPSSSGCPVIVQF